jgi:hypothetical protein
LAATLGSMCCALAADLQESMRRAFANENRGALE